MTSRSENETSNETNDIDSKQCSTNDNEQVSLATTTTTLIQEPSSVDESDKSTEINAKEDESTTGLRSVSEQEEEEGEESETKNSRETVNDHDLTGAMVADGEQHELHGATTVIPDEDENRSKGRFNSKFKYSSMSYPRSISYTNGIPYGSAPYFYYQPPPPTEKPPPLMFISTQPPPPTTSSSPSSRDNCPGGSLTVSPQNLPPRLRQASWSEGDATSVPPPPPPPPPPPAMSNGRRHRSILPRGSATYYSPHPPPPLMATPPGVLFSYPPAVHQTGHIAYNIRPPDELELIAFQQQLMNLPPPLIWPPPPPAQLAQHHLHPYPMAAPPTFLINAPSLINSTGGSGGGGSLLNPEAAEWIPRLEIDSPSSSDSAILIDDDINFPPLNSATTNINHHQSTMTTTKDRCEGENDDEQQQQQQQILSSEIHLPNSDEPIHTMQDDATTIVLPLSNHIDTHGTTLSSSQDETFVPSKSTTITYSTIILQTPEVNSKSNENGTTKTFRNNQRRQPNHVHVQLPPRDRTSKQQQQRPPPSIQSSTSNKDSSSRRRQPPPPPLSYPNGIVPNRHTVTNTRETIVSKPQVQTTDDWIEVKSKKTKKFDRSSNDPWRDETNTPPPQFETLLVPTVNPNNNQSEKLASDQQTKIVSSSLTSSSSTTVTSEDDDDSLSRKKLESIDTHDSGLSMVVLWEEKKMPTSTITNDYNQTIVDDIHRRLNNDELLLILMRGCPGSGKSTLAKSLVCGYNGLILSTDDYFKNDNSDQYRFDANKLEDAHRYNRRRASDAVRTKLSPIIIDNTNATSWEMRPYVAMGKEAGYEILFVEPQTPWRYKARELYKRNLHAVPLQRIKDMLNRYEHNLSVQSLVEQVTPTTTTIASHQALPQRTLNQRQTTKTTPVLDVECVDSVLAARKFYGIVDDSLILDDVRLCINDMILFITSNFYQASVLSSTPSLTCNTVTTTTTSNSQPSSPMSVSFYDISSIPPTTTTISTSSLPPTPSTPHPHPVASRFHRSLSRFSSTTQDHPFTNEHILRLPTTTFSRCVDPIHLTPPSSTTLPVVVVGKKRRKHKNKQTSSVVLLNTNNNNNNMNDDGLEMPQQQQQSTFHVLLAEDCPDLVVVDESTNPNNNNNWLDNVARNFAIQINPFRDQSSSFSKKQTSSAREDKPGLLNIIHGELNTPSASVEQRPSIAVVHVSVQCSTDHQIAHSYPILIGRTCSSSSSTSSIVLPPPPGFNERGIQVDLNEAETTNQADALAQLIHSYADRLPSESVQQFFELCQSNVPWTRTQIDEYLQHSNENSNGIHKRTTHDVTNRLPNLSGLVPTLRQLSLDALNEWDAQIKQDDPQFDKHSIGDLLHDINDDEILEDLNLDRSNSSSGSETNNPIDDGNLIQFIDVNQMILPWSTLDSLQELYGELPSNKSTSYNANGLILSLDDELSINIYQALQRQMVKSNISNVPVTTTTTKKIKKKEMNNQKRGKVDSLSNYQEMSQSNTHGTPSFKQIMSEQERADNCEKSRKRRPLDYASEHKFKELERQFSSFDTDLLYDIFIENEYNYEVTLAVIASMLDEHAAIQPISTTASKIQSSLRCPPRSSAVVHDEPVIESYEISRQDVRYHAQQRKALYAKANMANRHGMTGVASFYINQASEETRRMKEANQSACEHLSRRILTKYHQTQTLDLHGLHAEEALTLFKQIEQEVNDGNIRTTPKRIEIITGYGKNSTFGGGYGKIRSAILAYLNQRKYKYSEPHKGVIQLQLSNVRN